MSEKLKTMENKMTNEFKVGQCIRVKDTDKVGAIIEITSDKINVCFHNEYFDPDNIELVSNETTRDDEIDVLYQRLGSKQLEIEAKDKQIQSLLEVIADLKQPREFQEIQPLNPKDTPIDTTVQDPDDEIKVGDRVNHPGIKVDVDLAVIANFDNDQMLCTWKCNSEVCYSVFLRSELRKV